MTPDLFPEVRVDPSLDLDRRYTTRETMGLVMKLAGVDGWDLDAAADDESHHAETWYDVGVNGLVRPWFGRTFVNPPYSDVAPWVEKAWREMTSTPGPDVIAMLLPANRTEQPWWASHVEPLRDGAADRNWKRMHTDGDQRFSSLAARLTVHFLPGRVKFGHPGNPAAVGVGSPPFGCCLLVWVRS